MTVLFCWYLRKICVTCLLDVWLLESEVFLLVNSLEDDSDDECRDAEAGEHDQRGGIVVWHRGYFRSDLAAGDRVHEVSVAVVEDLADEQRE